MSQTIWYVRHGQSETNLQGIFAGAYDDTPLTKLGRQQAKLAGEAMHDYKIDCIVSSPLIRASKTAEIIAETIGFAKDIKIDERLREYDLGEGQGELVKGMTAARMISFPRAEDPSEFAERIKASLRDIIDSGLSTLIVAHGGVGRMIECLRLGADPNTFPDVPGDYPNADVIELDLSWL